MALATGQITINNIEETISVVFSKDNHVFPGGVSSALAGSVDISVKAYIGTEEVTYTFGSVTPAAPKGLAITPSSANKKITLTATESLEQASGTYNVQVKVKGVTITKTLSYAISFKGKTGDTGPQGPKGATGKQGPIGDTGTSVSSIVEWYLATNLSSGVTTSTDGWKTTMQSMTATKKYLWNYEVINFSDGSSSPTIPVIIGVYGNTGATGRALTGITEYYLASATASGVTRPSTDGTSGWTTTMQPTSISKPYLWNYEKLTWSVTPTTTYVEPIVIGVHGPQGPQGPQGSRGPQGIQGPIGPDGKATYTWIKYADTPTTGMKDLPDGKKYMGIAHNKPTATESTAYGDYTWSLIQGPQGNQGVQGPIGPNGQPTYTWIKYADDATGSGMNDSPTGKRFLGLAHNKTTATESTKASDYKWSPLYDNVQVGGRNLIIEDTLTRGIYLTASGSSTASTTWSVTDFIPVTGNTPYITSGYTNLGSSPSTCFYDASKVFISGVAGAARERVTTPSNAAFMRFSFQHQYLGTIKLEKGNIATDWTPAPEDLEERLVTHDTLIDANKKAIALRATTAAVGSIDTRLKAAEVKVKPEEITSTVRSSTDYINDQGKKVSTNEIISKINQTSEKITIDAKRINIKGAVKFESFDSSTAAEINAKTKTFVAKPTPPYSAGDIWKDGKTTKISKAARSSGSYVASDWETTGDVTGLNTAANTTKVGNTVAATVEGNAKKGAEAKGKVDGWTYTGKTTIDGGNIETDTIKAAQIHATALTAKHINTTFMRALKANIGTLTTGRIQSQKGNSYWDLVSGDINLEVSKLKIGAKDAATVEDLNNTLDGIVVGGRNLIESSYFDKSSSDYLFQTFDITETIQPGTEVTISLKGQLGSGKQSFSFYDRAGAKVFTRLVPGDKGSDGVYSKTFTWPTTFAEDLEMSLYAYPSSVNASSTVEWVKLEKGNKATDWTPSPRDLDIALSDKVQLEELSDVRDIASEALAGLEEKVSSTEYATFLDSYNALIAAEQTDKEKTEQEIADLLRRSNLVETDLGDMSETWTFINTFIKMADEGIFIGEYSKQGNVEAPTRGILISSGRISFIDGGVEVASISDQVMKINHGIFVESAVIGEHKLETNSSGTTVFTYVG